MYWVIPASEPRALLRDWSTTLSAEYQFARFQRPEELTGREGIVDLKTHTVPMAVTLNSKNGISLRITSTYVKQDGMLLAFAFGCVFIAVVLALAFKGGSLDDRRFEILRIVLALAGGVLGLAYAVWFGWLIGRDL